MAVLGAAPRFATPRTESRKTLGPTVANVMKALGYEPMPWQEQVLDVAYEVDDNGELIYREVILVVPRQAGKTSLMLAVQVHRALFFGSAQRSIYTAQSGNDARKKFVDEHIPLLQSTAFSPYFKVRLSNGSEGIKWETGSRHSIVAPTKKAGHGGTIDLAQLDEAFAFADDSLEQGLKPAMVTRKSAQFWIVSAAGDDSSVYLKAKRDVGRELARQKHNTGTAYFEWSADEEAEPGDPATWRGCHPAIGFTIDEKAIAADYTTMELVEFERAYLARWPKINIARVIGEKEWASCLNESSKAVEPFCFGFDIAQSRNMATICVASNTADGHVYVERIDQRTGVDWVVPRLLELLGKYRTSLIAFDMLPGAPLMPELEKSPLVRGRIADVLRFYTSADIAKSANAFYDAVREGRLRHNGDTALTMAVSNVEKRPLSGSWTWKQTDRADITPLRAASFALWAHLSRPEKHLWRVA